VRRHTIEPVLYWTPRILGTALAALVSLSFIGGFWYATAVPPKQPGLLAGPLAIGSIAIAVVWGVLAIAWRWGWLGGLVY
jgi:hypothetical protein